MKNILGFNGIVWGFWGVFSILISGCSTLPKTDDSLVKSHEELPLLGTIKAHRYLFKNDLRLLVVENHTSPTFAYQTWYRVGSINEVPRHTGLAHLFEHLMFKQTSHRSENESNRILDQVGTEGRNAFTVRDYTAYIQELSSGNLDLIAELESDRMANLVVNDLSFRTEREVVQNERRSSRENNPDGTLYDELYDLAFKKHPYHWPVIGYEKDLAEMSAQNAVDFYHYYYSPNHATVVVVGDVDPDHVATVVQKYYGNLPAKTPPEHEISVEPPQTKALRKKIKLNVQVVKLLLGYRIPGTNDVDIPALSVLQGILSTGRSSRLYRALVDTGLASSVQSDGIDDKDPSLMTFFVTLQKGTEAGVEKVILNEIAKISQEPVSDSELERAKNKMHFEFYEGLGSNFQKAVFLGHAETQSGDFREGIKYYERVNQITAQDVLAVAQKYLAPEHRTVIIGAPK